jgi:hypothetical protein
VELRGRESTGNQFPGPAEALAKEATIYVAEPFPHNLALVSVLYLSERPEMTSHGGKTRKAKTTKRKIKSTKGTTDET